MEKKENLVTIGFVPIIAIVLISFTIMLFTTKRNSDICKTYFG